ncbi:hypothetical protein LTS17_009372 [Exophiala oligosperma]
MIFKSPYPDLDIPETNVLQYVFPPGEQPSDEAIWIDASNPQKSLSPRQALPWIHRIGNLLDIMHVGVGEAVMILSPNHIFVPVAYLGIVGAGRVFSGANPIYTPTEIEYQIRNTGSRLILAHPSLLDKAIDAGRQAGLGPSSIVQFSDIALEPLRGIQDWRFMTEGLDHRQHDPMGAESKTILATVNYSSGTTGLPKGVAVSHYNIVANADQTIFMRKQGYKSPPQGQLYMCVMAPKMQIPVYIMHSFHYETFLWSIEKYRITHLQTAPPILVMLEKRPETAKYDLSSLKGILCGAAPLSRELQNVISNRFKVNITQGWGMTEVTCGAIHVPSGALDDTGSVGQLDPNTECKILDDNGLEVAPGEPGEMFIRGPQVCLGYWRNVEATRESIDSSKWLKTGDIAVVKDGWFWIVDRKKELIKVNGLQVAPAELEAVLLKNDHVADAGVVGITLAGKELPRAYIALQEGSKGGVSSEAIQEWMKSRVAKYKWLDGGIRFVDEVPKLASGKIQRKTLRVWAEQDAEEMAGRPGPRL